MAELDWDRLATGQPAPVVGLVRRCLERDPRRRLQAIGEARITIADFLDRPPSSTAASPPPHRSGGPRASWTRVASWVVLGAALGWIGSLAVGPRRHEVRSPPVSFSIDRAVGALYDDMIALDMSRDGRRVVFEGLDADGTAALYVKSADEAEPRLVPHTQGAHNPFLAPDGERLAFLKERGLCTVDLRGEGPPTVVAAALALRGGAWGSDGFIYFTEASDRPVVRVAEGGGEPTPVTRLDAARGERSHRWPALLSDGSGLLYTADTFESTEYYDDAQIQLLDLATGEVKVVLEGSSRAVWSPTGYLLFARDGTLFAQRFDLGTRSLEGTARPIVYEVSTRVDSGAVQFAVSAEGSLAYLTGGKSGESYDLEWLGIDGATSPVVPELGPYFQVSLSPTGDRVALTGFDQKALQVSIYELGTQIRRPLTLAGTNQDPVWTHAGDRIIFASARDGLPRRIFSKRADGSGPVEIVWDQPGTLPLDISPDDRVLAVRLDEGGTQGSLWMVDLQGETEPTRYVEDPIGEATFSPGGRYLAYTGGDGYATEGGELRVMVSSFPHPDSRWQVSEEQAREPRWSPDGSRLYYRAADGWKYVDVELDGSFRAGRPVLIESGLPRAPFDKWYSVGSDGRLLRLHPSAGSSRTRRVHVLYGWLTELESQSRPGPP